MGSKYKPSAAEKEATRLQNEELKRQKESAAKAKREASELTKAKRAAGVGSLMTGEQTGESSGYKSLLGG